MVDLSLVFPTGFLWGTATAAFQVEGGSAPNNWTAWEASGPGHVYQDQPSGLACDWWGGRYVEDFDRAAAMHNNAHRFSIEWSRIEPERGKFDGAAIDHYAAMIDALRQRGMEPLITLHHFTNPLWVEQMGGWTNEETVRRFARFVRLVVDELGDGIRMWCTINEPMVYATQGYLLGRFPPGKHSLGQTFHVAENMLRGHAAAYAAIKKAQPGAQIGFAQHAISLKTHFPKTVNKRALTLIHDVFNRSFVRALTTGVLQFPLHKIGVPEARNTLDWIGLNYYYRFLVRFNLLHPRQLFVQQTRPRDGIRGPDDSVGEIWPEGLFEHIKWLVTMTGKPLYVTENGVPDADDSLRPLHLVRSLINLWQAVNFNYPVKGYFYWTLVDNFEWAEGYDPRFRFGLYGCDPITQERTRRASAELYGEICAANGLSADMVRRFVPDQAEALFPGVEVESTVRLPPRS